MRPGHDRIERYQQHGIKANGLHQKDNGHKSQQESQLVRADCQDISEEKLLHAARRAVRAADNGKSEGHDGRKDNAYGHVRRDVASPLQGHDAKPYQDAKGQHGPSGITGKQQAQCHPGKGGMPDGVGEKGHAEMYYLDTEDGADRGQQQQP